MRKREIPTLEGHASDVSESLLRGGAGPTAIVCHTMCHGWAQTPNMGVGLEGSPLGHIIQESGRDTRCYETSSGASCREGVAYTILAVASFSASLGRLVPNSVDGSPAIPLISRPRGSGQVKTACDSFGKRVACSNRRWVFRQCRPRAILPGVLQRPNPEQMTRS